MTETEEALMTAVELLVPGFGPIVAAVGLEATFSIILLLGGKTVRIPTTLEIIKTLEAVEAAMDVRRGMSINEAAAKHGVGRHRMRTIVAHAQARWKTLDKLRAAVERDDIRRMTTEPYDNT
jgi:hypothetical protein